MHNHCDGCNAQEGNSCPRENTDGTCPCTLCILKMMCDNICEELEKWAYFQFGEDFKEGFES